MVDTPIIAHHQSGWPRAMKHTTCVVARAAARDASFYGVIYDTHHHTQSSWVVLARPSAREGAARRALCVVSSCSFHSRSRTHRLRSGVLSIEMDRRAATVPSQSS